MAETSGNAHISCMRHQTFRNNRLNNRIPQNKRPVPSSPPPSKPSPPPSREELALRRERMAQDGAAAMAEYLAEQEAIAEKTARLRAARLAREAKAKARAQ